MKPETIKKLCCPFDKSDLVLKIITKELNENILEGYLHCKNCMRIYPIISGIPIMNPDEYREFKLEQPILQNWIKNKISENFKLISTIEEI